MRSQTNILNIRDFLELSAFLNYQLSGSPVNWHGILELVLGGKKVNCDKEILVAAIRNLSEAYGQRKRKLGHLALLHPLSVAALFAKSQRRVDSVGLLAALYHDYREDITPKNLAPSAWKGLLKINRSFLQALKGSKITFTSQVDALTKRDCQGYTDYLLDLIDSSSTYPELIKIKLLDRLCNTYDLRLDLYADTDRADFHRILFEALFSPSYRGVEARNIHGGDRRINGSIRLYQLYKNAVIISLLRERAVLQGESISALLLGLLAASEAEAQNIILHIWGHHLTEPGRQRRIVRSMLTDSESSADNKRNAEYIHERYLERFRTPKDKLNRTLAVLYSDKEAMCKTALAFLIVFSCFKSDGGYILPVAPHQIKPDRTL